MVLESDALLELAHGFVVEFSVQFGLPEHYHLEELALLGFEVGQQPQGLQGFQWHRLYFVQADYDALAGPGIFQQ